MPHFSALTWRILAFNALALIVLTAGVILVQASGRGLVEERLNGEPHGPVDCQDVFAAVQLPLPVGDWYVPDIVVPDTVPE